MKKTVSQNLFLIVFFICLFAVIVLLRLPGISHYLCNHDLGTPSYAARLMHEGRCPYSEAVVSKPPGSIYLYGILFQFFGVDIIPVNLLALLWIMATAFLLFWIGRKSIGIHAGILAAAIYAFVQADLYSSGLCPNFEFWTILPAVGCLALLVSDSQDRPAAVIGMGALLSLAVSMKQTALFFLLATAVLLFERGFRNSEKGLRSAGNRLLWFGAGIGLAVILLTAPMLSSSCLGSMIDVLNPFKLQTYVSSYDTGTRWETAAMELARFWGANLFLLVLTGLSLLIFIFSKKLQLSLRRFSFIACICFLLAAALGVGAGGHFYDHYFVVLLPFMSLTIGLAIGDLIKRHGRLVHLGIIIPLLVMALILADSRYEIKLAAVSLGNRLERGANGLNEIIYEDNNENRYAVGHASSLIEDLEWQPIYMQAAEFMKDRIGPNDTIWVFDYMPEMYHYAKKFAPTRHQENFEIVYQSTNPNYGLWHDSESAEIDKNRQELMSDLSASPPRFIVLYSYDCPWNFTHAHYQLPEWPKNIHGTSVGNCKAKQKVFSELKKFLAEKYKQVDPPVNNAIKLYELIK